LSLVNSGKARRTRNLLARHGVECLTVTGAGTRAFDFESAAGVYTELQCGSYIFMDADYGRNLDRDGVPTRAFEPSLFVWATVMSRPTDDRAIVDAGLKALAFDSGPPLVCDEPAATYERASDEHGRLGISGATNRLQIGDKDPPSARPLRPNRKPLRLVRRHPRQPRRAALANHRPWRGLLTCRPITRGRASRPRTVA
jgi:D-serine deaminase-like pyridoxal phosphate-dependent protein